MKSKEKIIVEETGCDEEQAKLSLRESGDNLQKAIKSIASTLKYITVIKSKFVCEEISTYGLFTVIVNLRKDIIIRQAAVMAYNPAIYENELDLKWHIFEKKLYALRLHKGSLQETTIKFEQDLNRQIRKNFKQTFFQLIRDKKENELIELLRSVVSGSLSTRDVRMILKTEELSLNQFRELTEESISVAEKKNNDNEYNREIVLETELIEDDGIGDSIDVDKLKENDTVMTNITDSRDIAQYLSSLLVGKKRDMVIPLTATVEKIRQKDNDFIVDTRFSPGIIGRARVNRKIKIKMVKDKFEIVAVRRKVLWFLVTLIIMGVLAYLLLNAR